ncbi:hypothetical protein Lcho_0633 [Leptothrix cholodnii SP-6]|uniref:Uncharacterized protein n=1 Tax=Leptothrix cholodnii (strain ATCC 51168 / LMG 8142 / SP-6) TaxID=395495 RepID=B1XZR2_LEPCP|nr:hypothetical protein [Leptothrix cholodnii]ACB32908.1 hypothetical protein Lcho_0633 [Leptothrix cholodnii SP-6]
MAGASVLSAPAGGRSGRLEDWGIGEDAGQSIQAMLAAGYTDITCDTNCTIVTPVRVETDGVTLRLRCKVTWRGQQPRGVTAERLTGVITVNGSLSGIELTLPLAAAISDGGETVQLSDVSAFSVGDHWRVRPERSEWGPLSYLLQVTAVDLLARTVTFDYRSAWPVAAGTPYVFQQVIPVRNTSIFIQELEYATLETRTSGVAGIGEQYSIGGSAVIGKARNTKQPAVMKRWCVGGTSSMRDLIKPQDVVTGGMGYGIQLIHCRHERSTDTRATAARHVIDWSGCAHCSADGMYDTGPLTGIASFSCHQSFDHDNVLTNFDGWLSWANDPVFGQAMKRMAARNGIARGQLGTFNTSPDCTFEDIQVVGDVVLNIDGLTLRRVVESGGSSRFSQSSALSARKTAEVHDCTLSPWLNGDWVGASVTTPILFRGGRIGPMNEAVLRGTRIESVGTVWHARATPGQPAWVYTPEVSLNGTFEYTPWRIVGTASRFTASGRVTNYSDSENGFVDSRISSGWNEIRLSAMQFSGRDARARYIRWSGAGGTLKLTVEGSTASAGRIDINDAIGHDGAVRFSNCSHVGTAISRPPASPLVSYYNELNR